MSSASFKAYRRRSMRRSKSPFTKRVVSHSEIVRERLQKEITQSTENT
ncbi:unnamed protein product [Arabidopsis halleri]